MRNLFWWAIGGFVAYEVVAWKVNDSRIAASRGSGSYTPLPFDLIGKYIGYPKAGLPAPVAFNSTNYPGLAPMPASVTWGLADPAAARAKAFNSTTFPGVAAFPMPAPAFDPLDPLGLSRPMGL